MRQWEELGQGIKREVSVPSLVWTPCFGRVPFLEEGRCIKTTHGYLTAEKFKENIPLL